MERTCSWPLLNKFFSHETGDFTRDWGRLGLGKMPEKIAKMGNCTNTFSYGKPAGIL
jgi:hypothetical protein